MKKEIIQLFSLILLFSVAFSSCKDDDKLRTGVVYENDALALTVNGQTLAGKKAVINYLNSSEAQITLDQTIVGHDNIVFTVATSDANGLINLNGDLSLDDAEYKVTGNVTSADHLTISVTQKMTSVVVGKWYLQYSSIIDPDFGFASIEPSMIVSLLTDKPMVSFMGMEMRPAQVEQFLKTILSGYVKSLDWIEFNENGNVSLQFDLDANNKDVVFPDGQLLKEGDLKFYTKENKIYLAVKAELIDLLKPTLEGKVDFSKLPLIQTSGYYAMPMLYSNDAIQAPNQNNIPLKQGANCNIYVNKAMMQPMIGMMISLLDDETEIGGIKIKSIMMDLDLIMKEGKSFDLGLILAQNPAPAE